VFDDLERRLTVASAANAQPGSFGRYSATIATLQQQLAAANNEALTKFGQYVEGAKLKVPELDSAPQPGSGEHPAPGAGDAAGGDKSSQQPGQDNPGAGLNDPLDDPLANPAVGGPADAAVEYA
jgi:hypothetical protein